MAISLPVSIQTQTIRGGKDINIYYPTITGMKNYGLEKSINQAVADKTRQLINEQAGNIPSSVQEMIGYYEIKNNQREVLSLAIINYTYHYHAAHGMTYIKPLTFDLAKGKECRLKDLFKPDADYIKALSAMVSAQIKQREIPLLNGFTAIRPNQDFYIADKSLVIFFQLYEITPYYIGFPMFPISVYEIMDIAAPAGPLGRLAAG